MEEPIGLGLGTEVYVFSDTVFCVCETTTPSRIRQWATKLREIHGTRRLSWTNVISIDIPVQILSAHTFNARSAPHQERTSKHSWDPRNRGISEAEPYIHVHVSNDIE